MAYPSVSTSPWVCSFCPDFLGSRECFWRLGAELGLTGEAAVEAAAEAEEAAAAAPVPAWGLLLAVVYLGGAGGQQAGQ